MWVHVPDDAARAAQREAQTATPDEAVARAVALYVAMDGAEDVLEECDVDIETGEIVEGET